MAATDPDRIEQLLADALAAFDQGGEAAMAAFVDQHAQDRRALERGIARARQMGLLGNTAPVADFPDRLGEFRLLRRLGSGGMGVVYEAVQESLDRRVALKLVRPELLYFEGARERFRREIEAVARLSHPAIVPVLASGEQDGVPFYAMELLHGHTVHEVTTALRERDPAQLRGTDLRAAIGGGADTGTDLLTGPWWQVCTRITLAVAAGVRHAHLRGIVHRDIKPSNVMLTKDGRTVLLDFGVALVGGNREFTRTGNTPGSPAFMSPEQLRGDVVDERTDVYSLAATLWQLLTLQPPFSAQGDPQRVLHGDLASPFQHNRELPRELVLVLRTAMDVDRERRYADMQAFADDLQAVLQRRPIRARRLGTGLRLLRWSQRHRIASTLLACLLVVTAALPALLAWRERSHNQQLDRSLEVTLDVISSLLVRVGEERLRYVPAAHAAALESLHDACNMYRQLLPQHPGHVRMHVDAGKALSRYADLLARGGKADAAIASLREGIEILGGNRVDVPLPWINARCYLHVNLARTVFRSSDAGAAQVALDAALHDLEVIAAEPQLALDHQRNLAQVLSTRADQGDFQKAPAQMESDYRAALATAQAIAAARPHDAEDTRTVIGVLDNLATLLNQLGRHGDAEPLLRQAEALARALPPTARVWPPPPMLLSDVLETLGNMHVAGKDLRAVPLLKECLALRQQVAKDHPADLYVRSDLGAAWHNLARLNFQQGQDDLTVERLTQAVALQRSVRAEMPGFLQAQEYLRNHLTLMGSALANLGRCHELLEVAAELGALDTPIARRRAARLWLRALPLLQSEARADAATLRANSIEQALHNLLTAEQLGWGTGSAFGDKLYDPLRELPEFQALQQRIAARQSAAVSPPSTNSASREMPR